MTEAEKNIDANLEKVLRAAGTSIKNYTMQKSLDDMRKAMRKVMSECYIQGSHDSYNVYFKEINKIKNLQNVIDETIDRCANDLDRQGFNHAADAIRELKGK